MQDTETYIWFSAGDEREQEGFRSTLNDIRTRPEVAAGDYFGQFSGNYYPPRGDGTLSHGVWRPIS